MSRAKALAVLAPLEALLTEHLGDAAGGPSLRLLGEAILCRALLLLPGDALAAAGTDPHADRIVRRAYLAAFREVSPALFDQALSDRLAALERALEDSIVPA